jgi:hypothetical protein
MLVCYSYFVKINVLPYIKNQATDSQKVVNRKLGRMTVFAIYDRFIKLTEIPIYDIFCSQITDWIGAVVNRKS